MGGTAARAKAAALAWLAGALFACAGLPGLRETPQPACWPSFPYREGWLGGDAAYSIPLSPSRSLWLFGDSFVGEPGQPDRSNARFVHNSIGLSACRADASFDIRYFWGSGADGAPRAFLERGGPGWWWLFGGFLHAGRLYLGLLEVEPAEARGPLALPFRFTGTALARIDDPSADPGSWRPELIPLSRGSLALPLGAMLTHGAHLYLFTFLDRGDARFPRILLRLPLARLTPQPAELESALETLDASGAWRPGLAPESARILMDDNATEMSVRYHAALGRWLALYNYPDPGERFPETPTSDAVYLRSAERLEGPWSEPAPIFRIPELAQAGGRPADPHTGCYAAKEHPQFARPGSLIFTYVCNLFSGPGQDAFAILARLARRMDLYRPVAAAVSLPVPAAGAQP